MGDETVDVAMACVRGIAEINGLDWPALRPVIDTLVGRMREGLTDDMIEALFEPRP